MSWIGAPAGVWSQRAGVDLIGALQPLLGDAALRPRVLEALGASGLPAAGGLLLPWLGSSAEESTAAADALLRCADRSITPGLTAAIQAGSSWTREAAFSLTLLCQTLGCPGPTSNPGPPDPAEVERRLKWQAERPALPD